jgi:purine-binding chemotaxis protein CheW
MSAEELPTFKQLSPDASHTQLLTFAIGNEEYGLDILSVKKIRENTPTTPVPGVPPSIRGLINFHGLIIPVMDLRTRLGLDPAEYSRFSVVIVVSAAGKTVGLLADSVVGVLEIPAGDLQDAPVRAGARTPFIRAMARGEERLVIVLDVDEIVKLENKG